MTNETRCWCQNCHNELPPSHTGPCPKCGKTGKDFKRTLSAAIGLQSFMSYEHNERLTKGAKKDSGSRYQEQFDRVKRLYAQFELINQGIPLPSSLDFDKDKVYRYFFDALENPGRLSQDWWLAICQDQVYAFFQNCYHLKDWIENDGSVEVAESKIESFIDKNTELRLCADICNGTKHLCEAKRSGEDPQFGGRKTTVDVGRGTTIISVEYTIYTSTGRTIKAFDLAGKCLQAWETFIRSNINDEASGGKD